LSGHLRQPFTGEGNRSHTRPVSYSHFSIHETEPPVTRS
jgi:hypothetical protein